MASQEHLLERIRGAFAALGAECREDGGRPMNMDGLLTEARAALGDIDPDVLAQLLARTVVHTTRDAMASGLDPVALSFVTGLRVGEKLGYARGMERR